MQSVDIFEAKTKPSKFLKFSEPIKATNHRKRVAVICPNHAP